MSKYIIEIAEEYEEYFKGVLICGIADGKFAVDVIAREDLEELNSDYINENFGELQDEAYKQGYAEAERIWRAPSSDNEFYQKGLEDGKKSTEKGCEGCKYESYGDTEDPCWHCRKSYKDKYEPAPHSDRIEVGDEVIWTTDNIKLIVTSMYKVGSINWCDGVAQDGKVYSTLIENNQKTGKHYDIQSILEAMQNVKGEDNA